MKPSTPFKLWLCSLPMISIPFAGYAHESNDSIAANSKGGEERNVMLNASDATKPREIQIGLPSEDVTVYENGLPLFTPQRCINWHVIGEAMRALAK